MKGPVVVLQLIVLLVIGQVLDAVRRELRPRLGRGVHEPPKDETQKPCTQGDNTVQAVTGGYGKAGRYVRNGLTKMEDNSFTKHVLLHFFFFAPGEGVRPTREKQ